MKSLRALHRFPAQPLFTVWMLLAAGMALAWSGPSWKAVREMAGEMALAGPPDWPALGRALTGHLAALLAVPIVLAAPYGAGKLVALLAGIDGGKSRALRWALGLGTASIAFHGLGLAGLLFRPVLGTAVALLAALGAASFVRERRRPWWRRPAPGTLLPLAGLAAVLGLAFLLMRLPDTVEDALIAHFAAPEAYLLEHRIFAEPGNFLWHMPLGLEMVFLPAWCLGGIGAAKLVNIGVVLSLGGFAWSIARRLGGTAGKASGAWGALWALTAGFVLGNAWQGKNDLALAMFVAGAAWCMLSGAGGSRRLLGAAVLLGMGTAVKYSCLLFAASLACAMVISGIINPSSPFPPLPRWREGRVRERSASSFGKALETFFRGFVLAGLAGAIPLSGWMAANWLFLGNPLHPFLSGLFGELSWDPGMQSAWNSSARAVTELSTHHRLGWLLTVPSILGGPGGGSAALLALLPAALLAPGRGEAATLKWFAGITFLLWLPFRETSRYLYPLIPLLAALAGTRVAGSAGAWTRRLLFPLVLLLLFAGSANFLKDGGWKCLAGALDRSALFSARYGSWNSMREWVNANTPRGKRVLLAGEPRRLWMERRVLSYGPVFRPWLWKAAAASRDAAGMRKALRQWNISHIVLNQITAEYQAFFFCAGPEWTPRQLGLEADFLERYCRVARFPNHVDGLHGSFYIFSVSKSPAAEPGPLYFIPEAEGRFNAMHAAMEAGNYRSAREAWRRASSTVPRELYAQAWKGRLDWATGEYADGARGLEEGVKAGLATDLNLLDYGSCLNNLGRYDEAIRVFSRACLLLRTPLARAKLGTSLYGRGWVRLKQGDPRGAARDLEKAVPLWTESPLPRRWLARALKETAGN